MVRTSSSVKVHDKNAGVSTRRISRIGSKQETVIKKESSSRGRNVSNGSVKKSPSSQSECEHLNRKRNTRKKDAKKSSISKRKSEENINKGNIIQKKNSRRKNNSSLSINKETIDYIGMVSRRKERDSIKYKQRNKKRNVALTDSALETLYRSTTNNSNYREMNDNENSNGAEVKVCKPSDTLLYYNIVTTERSPEKRRVKARDYVIGQYSESDSENDSEYTQTNGIDDSGSSESGSDL